MFVRIYTVSPQKKELFAIRALLMERPGPRSFEDLRTINGIVYPTYTQAAQVLNLLESDEFFQKTLDDAEAQHMSDRELQHYFARLVFHGIPANAQALFDYFLDKMLPQPIDGVPENVSREIRRRKVVRNLEYFFRCMGTSCK